MPPASSALIDEIWKTGPMKIARVPPESADTFGTTDDASSRTAHRRITELNMAAIPPRSDRHDHSRSPLSAESETVAGDYSSSGIRVASRPRQWLASKNVLNPGENRVASGVVRASSARAAAASARAA